MEAALIHTWLRGMSYQYGYPGDQLDQFSFILTDISRIRMPDLDLENLEDNGTQRKVG